MRKKLRMDRWQDSREREEMDATSFLKKENTCSLVAHYCILFHLSFIRFDKPEKRRDSLSTIRVHVHVIFWLRAGLSSAFSVFKNQPRRARAEQGD
jgi:hypothetical protein